MPITNPTELVDEFKKSGEFDRLRRELLSKFQKSEGISSFKARIEDLAQQRLASDQKLRYMLQELVQKELMQEMDRYPTVERAASDFQLLSDPSFAANLNKLVQGVLRENKGQKTQPQNENEGDVNSGLTTKPVATRPPKAADIFQQDSPQNPSTEDIRSLQTQGAQNSPPPNTVLEKPPTTPEEKLEKGR